MTEKPDLLAAYLDLSIPYCPPGCAKCADAYLAAKETDELLADCNRQTREGE